MTASSDIRCPRCREPYRKAVIPSEWAQCVACRHRWLIPADAVTPDPSSSPVSLPDSSSSTPPVTPKSSDIRAVLPVPPVVPPVMPLVEVPASVPHAAQPELNTAQSIAPLPALPLVVHVEQNLARPSASRFPSDEYKPIETREINDLAKPLTTKHTPTDAKPAVMVPAQADPLPATPVHAAAHAPVPARMHAKNNAPPRSVENMDENLFERAADEAQAMRSQQPTLAEPIVPQGVPLTAYCSMCGCRFTTLRKVGEWENCPDCKATVPITAEIRAPAGDPLLGRTLRGCVIDRKIGEGGMGSVYHAKQLSLERSVAIKVLPPELARNRNFITRFEREGKNLARINHPNILHIYDFGDDAQLGLYFMIIEFVEGQDLGEILHKERRLSSVKVLDVLRQSALGLETAWEKGVIHRDIKPDNLMLTEDGIWKVMDFGLAKASDDSRDVTALGVRVGTPAFMSPEQCDGTEVDFRSDIYSLGCTAFLALTGRLPFDGETPFSIMLKHKTEAVPSLRELVPEIPEVVEELVTRMLAKKPAERFQSLRELIELVQDLEIRLADTTSVVRKSRGPFRAMVEPHKESDREKSLPAVSRARQTSARPPMTPMGMPVARDAIPAAEQAPEVPDYLQLVERPAPVAKTSETGSPRPASSRLSNYQTPRATSSGENLRQQLARVRSRTQQDEASSLIAEAEQCEESGLHAAAAIAWEQAADMVPDVAEGRLLQARANAARRRNRWQRLMRTAAILTVVVGVLSISTWIATPRIHNAIADGELQAVMLAQNPLARRKALERFLEDQGHAYRWYEQIFSTSYAVTAAIRARDELSRIPKVPLSAVVEPLRLPVETAVSPQVQVDTFERLIADNSIPWSVISNRLTQAMPMATGDAQRRLQSLNGRVQLEMAAIDKDFTAISSAWTAGRHVETMALVEAFVAQHPRSGMLIRRLVPSRAEVIDADSGRVISEAQLSVQPLDESPGIAAITVPVGRDGVFVRPEGIGMVLNVAAPFYRGDRIIIPASADGIAPVKIALHPGQAWHQKLGNRLPWMRVERLDDTMIAVLGPDLASQVQIHDGKLLAHLERNEITIPADLSIGAPQWNNVWSGSGDQISLGSADGVVVEINPLTMTLGKTIYRGKTPILAWLQKDITLQAGKVMQIKVEGSDGAMALVAAQNGQDRWRRGGLRGRRQPALWARDDQILVMDDQALSIFEEQEGRPTVVLPFSGPRISAPVIFAQGQLVATATANGLDVFQIAGGTYGPLSTRGLFDNDGTGCYAAGRDDQILVARGDRSLHLVDWTTAGGLARRWKKTLPGDSGTVDHLTLTQDYAIVADDGGVMYLYSRQDGSLQRRITHGAGLALAPLQFGERLLVGDRDGRLTMYELPRLR